MSFFDTFMVLTILKDIFDGLMDLATSPDTAKWFWGISLLLILILSVALAVVSIIYQ